MVLKRGDGEVEVRDYGGWFYIWDIGGVVKEESRVFANSRVM